MVLRKQICVRLVHSYLNRILIGLVYMMADYIMMSCTFNESSHHKMPKSAAQKFVANLCIRWLNISIFYIIIIIYTKYSRGSFHPSTVSSILISISECLHDTSILFVNLCTKKRIPYWSALGHIPPLQQCMHAGIWKKVCWLTSIYIQCRLHTSHGQWHTSRSLWVELG